jgi:hypothetical protein
MNFVRIDVGNREHIRRLEDHASVPFSNNRKLFVEDASDHSAVAIKGYDITFKDLASLPDDLLYSEGAETIYIGPVNMCCTQHEKIAIDNLWLWANDYKY